VLDEVGDGGGFGGEAPDVLFAHFLDDLDEVVGEEG
jgi:hypothetical protein